MGRGLFGQHCSARFEPKVKIVILPFRRSALALLSAVVGLYAVAVQARSFYVTGSGGVPLAVTDVGPPNAPEILFLHGLDLGRDSFRPQLESSLATKFHMVAFDLRGHGMSGKPWDETAYTNPQTWADDVAKVMAATGLKRPVIVAWSYGTLVASDYIRERGANTLSGLMLISALGGLTPIPPPSGPTPANFVKSVELRASLNLDSREEGVRLLLPYLTAGKVSSRWTADALELELMVPPFVAAALRKHPSNNQDLLPKLNLPVKVVYGKLDTGMKRETIDAFLASAPSATAIRYDASSHSPFAEEPDRFNQNLSEFVLRVWRGDSK